MGDESGSTSGDFAADQQRRLRRHGLRPVQIWVPDVTSAEFAAEAHRQSALVAASSYAEDDQAFVDAISWFSREDEA